MCAFLLLSTWCFACGAQWCLMAFRRAWTSACPTTRSCSSRCRSTPCASPRRPFSCSSSPSSGASNGAPVPLPFTRRLLFVDATNSFLPDCHSYTQTELGSCRGSGHHCDGSSSASGWRNGVRPGRLSGRHGCLDAGGLPMDHHAGPAPGRPPPRCAPARDSTKHHALQQIRSDGARVPLALNLPSAACVVSRRRPLWDSCAEICIG